MVGTAGVGGELLALGLGERELRRDQTQIGALTARLDRFLQELPEAPPTPRLYNYDHA